MDKSYVLIAGTGVTSRANLEALVEDYFYAKGKDTCLVLAFDKMPSQGQVFASQYAKDKGKDIVVFCKDGANVSSIPSTASASFTETPTTDAIDMATTVMLLWDDSDQNCMVSMEHCVSVGKVAYNLCEGLTAVNQNTVVAPVVEKTVESSEPKTKALDEALKAEIIETVLAAVKAALKDALKKA
jgi:hypothetical protein